MERRDYALMGWKSRGTRQIKYISLISDATYEEALQQIIINPDIIRDMTPYVTPSQLEFILSDVRRLDNYMKFTQTSDSYHSHTLGLFDIDRDPFLSAIMTRSDLLF